MAHTLKLFRTTLIKLILLLSFCSAGLSLFVDSRFLTDRIEAGLNNISGVNWVILGPVRFTVLSGPGVEIRGIVIEQPDGYKAPQSLFKLPRLNLRVDVPSLLNGRLELKEIVFHAPRLYAKAGKNGRNSLERMIDLINSGQVNAPAPPFLPPGEISIADSAPITIVDSPPPGLPGIPALNQPEHSDNDATEKIAGAGEAEVEAAGPGNVAPEAMPDGNINNAGHAEQARDAGHLDSTIGGNSSVGAGNVSQQTSPPVGDDFSGARIKRILSLLRRIEIRDASIYIEKTPQLWVRSDNINLSMLLPGKNDPDGNEPVHTIFKTHILAPSLWVEVPDSPAMDVNIEARLDFSLVDPDKGWRNLPLDAVQLWLKVVSDPVSTKPNSVFGKANLEIDGVLNLKNGLLRLPNFSIQADGIDASGKAEVRDLFNTAPVTRADIDVANFSETRWLGYARRLPLGLRHILNKASARVFVEGLGSHFTFNAPRIIAAGTIIRGKGVVPDFRNPSLFLEFWTNYVDANNIIPELAPANKKYGYSDPPPLDMPAPLPFPRKPGAPTPDDEENFEYEVIINADSAKVNLFTANNLRVRIFPNNNLVGITADAADLYGGTAAVRLGIDDNIDLKVDVQNAATNKPSILLFDDIRTSGNLNLNFNGTLIGRIMKGDIEASSPQGLNLTILGSPGGNNSGNSSGNNDDVTLPFSRVQAKGKGFVFEREGRHMKIQGNLNGNLNGPFTIGGVEFNNVQVNSAQLKQPTYFNLDTRNWTNLEKIVVDGQGKGSLQAFGQKRNLDAKLRGDLGIQMEKKGVSLDNMAFEAFNSVWNGSFRTERLWGSSSSQPTLFDGKLRFQSSRLMQFMQDIGLQSAMQLEPRDPEVLARADFNGSIHSQGDILKIQNLTGSLDGTRVKLDLDKAAAPILQNPQATGGSVPKTIWNVNLELGKFNLDSHRPPSRLNPPKSTPWNLDVLRNNDVTANIKVEHLRVISMDFHQLSLPLTIRNGKITSRPITATFYSGPLTADLFSEISNAGTTPAMVSQLHVNAERADFGKVMESMAGKRFADGQMKSQLSLSGQLRSLDDIPAGLSGSWSIDVVNGRYYTSPDTDKKGSAFSSATANGEMKLGVLTTDNFRLYSGLISMQGRGTADLNKNTVDQSIDVMVVKGPTLPVRITGKLSSPDISVNAIAAVPSTVYQVTKGILTLPLRIFGYSD